MKEWTSVPNGSLWGYVPEDRIFIITAVKTSDLTEILVFENLVPLLIRLKSVIGVFLYSYSG
jgi:hypothetical protein